MTWSPSPDRPGLVEVMATVGGLRDFSKARRFLVPEGEYTARGPHGFVVGDPSRYEEIMDAVPAAGGS